MTAAQCRTADGVGRAGMPSATPFLLIQLVGEFVPA